MWKYCHDDPLFMSIAENGSSLSAWPKAKSWCLYTTYISMYFVKKSLNFYVYLPFKKYCKLLPLGNLRPMDQLYYQLWPKIPGHILKVEWSICASAFVQCGWQAPILLNCVVTVLPEKCSMWIFSFGTCKPEFWKTRVSCSMYRGHTRVQDPHAACFRQHQNCAYWENCQ